MSSYGADQRRGELGEDRRVRRAARCPSRRCGRGSSARRRGSSPVRARAARSPARRPACSGTGGGRGVRRPVGALQQRADVGVAGLDGLRPVDADGAGAGRGADRRELHRSPPRAGGGGGGGGVWHGHVPQSASAAAARVHRAPLAGSVSDGALVRRRAPAPRTGSPAKTAGGSRHGSAARPARASRIARHTRSGVHGRSMWRTPSGASASITAFCTAGVEPIVADSPMPLAPSGLSGVGVSVFVGLERDQVRGAGDVVVGEGCR